MRASAMQAGNRPPTPFSLPATLRRLLLLNIREYVEFDSWPFKAACNYLGTCIGGVLFYLGRERRAFDLMAKLHRSNCGRLSEIIAERIAHRAVVQKQRSGVNVRLRKAFGDHIFNQLPQLHTQRYFDQPERLLGSVAMVLKSPNSEGKGVIVVCYSYVFPLFARLFDVRKIAKDYLIVFEPSWSGYCNWDILCYSHLECPVFVQANEPRDYKFIEGLQPHFWPVPIAANSWVDHRVFRPIEDVKKDIDLIMVAGWADFKRHHRVFNALGKLRKRGVRLKAVFIGYPMNQSRDRILDAATYYGVRDQLEIYESLTPNEVNRHLNRAKVNLIWSRKEGVNRAIVEGMFADVPCLLREGFNYGYHYPHINSLTGCYANEQELPDKLIWMADNREKFSPRAWVEANMSCQRATDMLTRTIESSMAKVGEPWSGRLAVKVNGLHGMQYWEPQEKETFVRDYSYLASCIQTGKPA